MSNTGPDIPYFIRLDSTIHTVTSEKIFYYIYFQAELTNNEVIVVPLVKIPSTKKPGESISERTFVKTITALTKAKVVCFDLRTNEKVDCVKFLKQIFYDKATKAANIKVTKEALLLFQLNKTALLLAGITNSKNLNSFV